MKGDLGKDKKGSDGEGKIIERKRVREKGREKEREKIDR